MPDTLSNLFQIKNVQFFNQIINAKIFKWYPEQMVMTGEEPSSCIFFKFNVQSSSVVTNNSGPAIFVLYNRVNLCIKKDNFALKPVHKIMYFLTI